MLIRFLCTLIMLILFFLCRTIWLCCRVRVRDALVLLVAVAVSIILIILPDSQLLCICKQSLLKTKKTKSKRCGISLLLVASLFFLGSISTTTAALDTIQVRRPQLSTITLKILSILIYLTFIIYHRHPPPLNRSTE